MDRVRENAARYRLRTAAHHGGLARVFRPCPLTGRDVTLISSILNVVLMKTPLSTSPPGWRDLPPAEHTIRTYFDAFGPVPAWDRLVEWPADVYCLCSLVLDQTEAYRFAIAPPFTRRWPPMPDWNARVEASARDWATGALPWFLRRHWNVLRQAGDTTLSAIRAGEAWEVCEALLTLHALADEAHAGLDAPTPPEGAADRMRRAWSLLGLAGTLSNVSSRRVRVLPKSGFTPRGITIRSMSRYLALCYESVEVHWGRIESEVRALAAGPGERPYNVLLVPWPRNVRAGDFRPVRGPLENMDATEFGFFEFAPEESTSGDDLESLLEASAARADRVDAVVLPEAAILLDQLPVLEEIMERFGVRFLITGVRQPGIDGALGRNYVHFGALSDRGWQRYEQDKHHRWCLDGNQIRQYHLARSLDPAKLWWEAIDVRPRALNVIDVGGGATAAPLVCEDLARMDEVADLLRRIGPTIVVAVLLDGPQLSSRWPRRYAAILADEPGSAVLTLTAYGMVRRSRPEGLPLSRVIALWNDRLGGIQEIALARGAQGVLLETMVRPRTTWTADGRRHEMVPEIVFVGSRQIRSGRVR